MKKVVLLSACLLVTSLYSNVTIRLATPDDLPWLMDLDKRVSLEDYVPLVPQFYIQYFTTQEYLDSVMAEVEIRDREFFQKGIDLVDDHRVHVAIDDQLNKLVAFIIYFKEDKKLMFYFGTVDRVWRRQGIGSQLIKAAIAEFNDIELCHADPLQYNRKLSIFLNLF